MQANGYTERVKKYLDEICPQDGYEVDSVTFTQENNEWYLRAFIYRADGVDMTVDDCAKVSRKLSKWLDKEDFIPEQYMLEVCSLGFKEHPGNADVEPQDVDAETLAEESTENESEDIITGRGKNK
ncbi:hypothetical protein UYO_0872 [Lachnospiraceae bacterium JC7]|nr:hypothetical protein UYO_0872 [Lachnospiraceae bacterium JC7]